MESKRFYNYLVYEDGSIYSLYKNRFLKPDITIHKYQQVTLVIDGKSERMRVHQLVAKLWLGEPTKERPTVNHEDGNKMNNHYTNLEYASYYENNKHARDTGLNNISESNYKRWQDEDFREKVSKRISETLISSGIRKGEKNGRYKYDITINNQKISRTELAIMLNKSQSYIDACIKKASEGREIKIFLLYNVKVKNIKS